MIEIFNRRLPRTQVQRPAAPLRVPNVKSRRACYAGTIKPRNALRQRQFDQTVAVQIAWSHVAMIARSRAGSRGASGR